jgi:DNA-directed RNA polymerase specialized sigma24 family protein
MRGSASTTRWQDAAERSLVDPMIQVRPQPPLEAPSPREERDRRLRASFRNSGDLAVNATGPILLRIARRIGLCAEAARDVLQEVYCALLGRDPLPDDIEAWLGQVMRFQSWRWLHEQRLREGRDVPLDGLDFPGLESVPPELRLDLVRAVADLTDQERRILNFHYVDGFSEREAAVRADYAPMSGKKVLARIRDTLRRALGRPAPGT